MQQNTIAHNFDTSSAWTNCNKILLALVIPCCRSDQFSRSYLPVAVLIRNLQPSDVFSGGALSSFKSAMNLCLQKALFDVFPLFILISILLLSGIIMPYWFIGGVPFPSSVYQVILITIIIQNQEALASYTIATP